jgi:DUF971 family protein
MNQLVQAAVIGGELALAWGDGGESFIPLEKLRRNCPCAECQGEPDALGRVVVPERSYGDRAFELLGFERVGGYALQMRWADGHHSGIYSFDLLRRLG